MNGTAFQWTGAPTGGACTPSCTAGYPGANDYLWPRGAPYHPTPFFTWKPLAGRQSYFVIVADPSFSNLVDYAFTQLRCTPRAAAADYLRRRDHALLLGDPPGHEPQRKRRRG